MALGDAWQSGAQFWSSSRREAFANDPLELLAVDGPANEAKGDADDASWLPPNRSFRCAYVARQVAVKKRYHLWMTPAEAAAARRVLGTCPGQRLPVERAPIPASVPPTHTHSPTPTPTSPARPSPSTPAGHLDPRFATCAAANKAGYGPYYKGKDPEYYWYEDRDHDGIDCER